MGIGGKILELKSNLPAITRLVAVSKTKTPAAIMEAYAEGQRIFGENKVQELVAKYECLPKDILWHMIGHLQTNKVKYIAPFVDMIHSVDSLKLLQNVNNEAIKNNRTIKVLLQVFIATEETKYGLSCDELEEIMASGELNLLLNIKLCGLMGMASFTNDESVISTEFSNIKTCFDVLKLKYYKNDADFCELSIGMSADYAIALKHGSTLVRIGNSIFGYR